MLLLLSWLFLRRWLLLRRRRPSLLDWRSLLGRRRPSLPDWRWLYSVGLGLLLGWRRPSLPDWRWLYSVGLGLLLGWRRPSLLDWRSLLGRRWCSGFPRARLLPLRRLTHSGWLLPPRSAHAGRLGPWRRDARCAGRRGLCA